MNTQSDLTGSKHKINFEVSRSIEESCLVNIPYSKTQERALSDKKKNSGPQDDGDDEGRPLTRQCVPTGGSSALASY